MKTNFFDLHDEHKHKKLNKHHIGPADVIQVLKNIGCQHIIVNQIAESFEGRPIHLVTLGSGDMRVFAWSQMHGDEPTATASLLDFLVYVKSDTGLQWYETWKDEVTLHLLPMLNPDGAEAVTRENAQLIDINRDAIRLQSSEGQLLHRLFDDLAPKLAFNLHDQNPYYTAGKNGPKTLIAFMAPPPDEAKSITSARRFAMQIIGYCVDLIDAHIEGQIARYDDTYSCSSFGDLAATKSIPCILIESGYEAEDPNRQIPRKMNFVALCHTLSILSTGASLSKKETIYHNLPMNFDASVNA